MASQAAFKKFVPEPKAQDSLAPQRTVFVSGSWGIRDAHLWLTVAWQGWTRK